MLYTKNSQVWHIQRTVSKFLNLVNESNIQAIDYEYRELKLHKGATDLLESGGTSDPTLIIDIDRLFINEENQDDWSSSDEELLQEPKRRKKAINTMTQNQDIIRDDSELCASDNNLDDDSEHSDCDEIEWKKVNLKQLDEMNKIYEENCYDFSISPNYFFSIVTPPVEYFERFFDKYMIGIITEQTNLYAHQINAKKKTGLTQIRLK
ncbi:unnamed protein product [Euphydryas editha]|uniref:PiggyBac transposable element-derived protein domain-containing protein n=1 Tax=Euphydryas editha TaxID=104508 RepID=A0AAU9UNW8_EUPED|nr:unnamed protein product [Euphydryas editha]